MSNHFTGLSLGPPLGDQRLDLCDLYAFLSPSDPTRTVLILNANPAADALHPDAIYRLNVDQPHRAHAFPLARDRAPSALDSVLAPLPCASCWSPICTTR
jgi:hypothetical protein